MYGELGGGKEDGVYQVDSFVQGGYDHTFFDENVRRGVTDTKIF